MSEKYVIKNCECKVKGKTTLCVRDIPYKKCENINDCVMKKIVELCNETLEQENDPINTLEMSFAQKILQLLDIEECE